MPQFVKHTLFFMYYNARKYYIEEVTTQQNEETLSLLFQAE